MTDEEIIIKALNSYFDRENPPKFINVSRIPLICQDIKAIRDSIGRLEKAVKTKEDDHEERIRKVEQTQWKWAGAAGVLSALGMWAFEKLQGK